MEELKILLDDNIEDEIKSIDSIDSELLKKEGEDDDK